MSILIRDMEMPTEPMVLILFPDGNISTEEYEIGANAKAIELPPHGRLIDADALIEAVPPTNVDIFENCRRCELLDQEQVIDLINDAPTIIESEGE